MLPGLVALTGVSCSSGSELEDLAGEEVFTGRTDGIEGVACSGETSFAKATFSETGVLTGRLEGIVGTMDSEEYALWEIVSSILSSTEIIVF